ncbi:WD40 repeat domain-containing protein [Streptomyces sp. NPDC058739]|uniref:WD40 repeat domain-containing protein n=1 Tax=Streptomyces sp. NPDC058739 TaxID=3346618 RepID=UPI0036CFB4E5
MRRSLAAVLSAAAACLLVGLAQPASAADGDEGFTIKDPRITESSGLTASRQHPGIYWTHNDQDTGAFLYAVDSATGETVATVTMTGVGAPRDVEGIAMGPDNQLYVGDIGDNLGGTWEHVWVYKLPEPKELKDQSVRATQYVVKYADGPRDAESILVHPKTGDVYLIDKNEDGGHLYAARAPLSPSGTNMFERVAPIDLWATDAAFSPDGERFVVRGYLGGIAYDWNDGKPQRLERVSVPLGQGESVSYSADGTKLMLGMEGAGSAVEAQDAPGGSGGSDSPSSGGGSGAAADGDEGGSGLRVEYVVIGAVALGLFGVTRLRRRRS